MLQQLPIWAAALWWGSLTTLVFLVVPLLFAHLPTAAQAGHMAAKLFTAQTWVTVVCTVLLLLASRPREGEEGHSPLQAARLYVTGGLLLALLLEFAVAPRILARENFVLWHRMGGAMYVLQWVCAAVTLWRLQRQN
ncbi:MAG: DUF4149 domain-containing protein [Gammaproteobacteria bacterium]|nr:DUF4149 domain-containing protein [Gammaproteobacteria bacterium]